MDAKSRVARRTLATGADDNFTVSAARASDVLHAANRQWHVVHRIRAYVSEVATGGEAAAPGLSRSEEERLRLEEISFVLENAGWDQVMPYLPQTDSRSQPVCDLSATAMPEFFETFGLDLQRFRDAVKAMQHLCKPTSIGSPHGESSLLADLEILSQLARRAQLECAMLQAAFLRAERSIAAARATVSETAIVHVSRLIGTALSQAKAALGFVARWSAVMDRLNDGNSGRFTTIQVTFRPDAIVGQPLGSLTAMAETAVPARLPFSDSGHFWADGSQATVTLRTPIFYAGRLALRAFCPATTNRPPLDIALDKIEVFNQLRQRRSVEPTLFHKDPAGRLVSPMIYLP